MSRATSSAAKAAREALAARLRDLRVESGLTAREVAAYAGWHPSKSSRIENAVTAPSDSDIRFWCVACGAEDQVPDLIAAARSIESMYLQWKRVQRSGLKRVQESRIPLYQRTRLFRVYCSHVVPGLLQIRPYTSALFRAISEFHDTPDDVYDAVSARLERSRVVREGDHRFLMLIEQSVLTNSTSAAEAMAEQLRHLLKVTRGVIQNSKSARYRSCSATFRLVIVNHFE